MNNPKITTDNDTLAVDLSECRAFARLSESEAPDEELTLIVEAATRQLEGDLGRSFINKTYTYKLDTFGGVGRRNPGDDFWYRKVPRNSADRRGYEIEIPVAPLVSITSIKYTNTAGVEGTVSTDDYQTDTHNEPGRVAPSASATTWPVDVGYEDYLNPVEIIFVAGYGTTSGEVDYRIRHAICMLAAHYWENREATTYGMPLAEVNPGYWQQVVSYRIRRF